MELKRYTRKGLILLFKKRGHSQILIRTTIVTFYFPLILWSPIIPITLFAVLLNANYSLHIDRRITIVILLLSLASWSISFGSAVLVRLLYGFDIKFPFIAGQSVDNSDWLLKKHWGIITNTKLINLATLFYLCFAIILSSAFLWFIFRSF